MKKSLMLIGVVLILSGAFLVNGKYFEGLVGPIQEKKQIYSGPVDNLTVGKQAEYGTLFVVAKEQGFFKAQGLDVTIREYESGAPAFANLLKGEIDMTNAAEFVGVRNSFLNEDFKILGSIGTATSAWEIIARRDRGINNISDLKGKKIGLPRKTLGEFFLGNFLLINKISLSDVKLIDNTPLALSEAILSGSIDAVMIFEPHVFNIKQTLGSNAVNWSGQSDRLNYILLYASGNTIRNKPEAVKRFIKSLVMAEEYLKNTDGVVEKFMKETLRYNDAYVSSVLPKFRFFVALEQPMLLLMEDEARWVIENKLTTGTKVPNYLNFIYFDALSEVNPEAITIIR
ncbi:MAG TPA: NrtA/SsuA/CpmA family ABC transporter substrate-binding protein [Candidatus Limnocylindrales bacterium]|nr:NrtA/SsuA/CpmA family ABC transporter substrate-binding protein [Candidatus Limnocylindrales bacterium]